MAPQCELLVIGGSAGSLNVLLKAMPLINLNNRFAILIVLHRNKDSPSLLAELFSHRTRIAVKEAEEKEEILPDRIYIAPPDYHLLIEKNKTFSLDYSEKINFSRPCIDATFQTAAEAYGDKLTCVLLSGSNADGAEGLEHVKKLGGITAIQDPDTCEMPFMTRQALLRPFRIDSIIDGARLADFINKL